ncbi:DUF654-domain-containing protein [Massarina eburnea CBS 473.64]|uniref:DUF654-domain-containing protein n=1 Tax=Massarina eburnea CBS 473.64 TaxID=1395130 RepID=A0A6A6RM66_9PLEO|nr:DUF654-domain-containing protein [Massarina eburnea CBS 473.64]
MSSRALRRAQRELEEKKQLDQLAQEKAEDDAEQEDEDEDEEEEEKPSPVAKSKMSMFAMLGDADDGNGSDDGEEDMEPVADASESESKEEPVPVPQPSKKSKKKKKKAKGKAKVEEARQSPTQSRELDEIDQALLALKVTSDGKSGSGAEELSATISEEKQHLYAALSIDKEHLHAANEMKKLFGRAAVHGVDDDEPRARQRRGGPPGGIAAAIAGRNVPGNRNLASLGLRRNIFIQGKEEWPRATSGGLGMEVVEKRSDGTVEYRFVHSTAYQSVQQQFETCVASMDPERMIQLLHFNPYHISTLLQVSEIAKQQRDNATAGELLERALFALGRAVHSTFAHNLSQGRARLDFRRPENREFWLAVWRYIGTLGVRATWRTAFEWAKLILSMSPEDDPYCMRLLVDQLALRGREPKALVDIVESDHLQRAWKIPPNLAYSVALAHDRLKQPQEARKALRLAIKEYPWIASRLCKELDISPIPKSVWGKMPHGVHQELLCELYVPHTKDLWNTTEGSTLLVEVCYSFEEGLGAGDEPYWLAEINELDMARHVILSDDRSLMNLLDPRIKSKFTSTSDPLPPTDNIKSYSTTIGLQATNIAIANQAQLHAELERLRRYFQTVDLGAVDIEDDLTEEDLLRALERAETSMEEFQRNEQRLQQIRPRLQELGFPGFVQGGAGDAGGADGARGGESDMESE